MFPFDPRYALTVVVGCGKTVLFSAIVKHLQTIATTKEQSISLGYYYCRVQNDTHDDLNLVLRRWLAQISDKFAVPKCLQKLHDACHAQYPPQDPTSEELEAAFIEVIKAHSSDNATGNRKTFLLIDALDELSLNEGQSDEILDMLHRIAGMSLAGISILATSREHAAIAEYLAPEYVGISVDYDAIDREIAAYVPRAIDGIPRLKRQSPEVRDAITARLVSEAKGM
jgi:hypothetical protein